MMLFDVLLAVLVISGCWCTIAEAAPRPVIDHTPSFIASQEKALQHTSSDEVSSTETTDQSLKIRGLRVTSSVTARFTKTIVTSHVVNPADKGQEVNFYIELPEEAFISGFLIETEGEVYQSTVDEKEKAQKAYDHARSQGQTTGQVKQTSEEKNDFTISINVAAGSMLSFNLTYEELLKRKDGYFENSISISPGQPVEHLIVDVHIIEPQGINEESVDFFVKKLDVSNGNTVELHPGWVEMKGLHHDRANVQFHPTAEEQAALSTSGNLGKFVVRYDVVHEHTAGDIQIVNGYFVHHFSPEGFKPTQKNVVFVLDTSGSMSGTKIRQTREAMETILSDLREKDEFGIVTFASSTRAWRPSMVPANRENIQSAKNEIRRLYALGGTNLHGGIVDAIAMLEEAERNAVSTVGTFSLIIVLTDGMPTAGITSSDGIKTDIRRRLEGRFSLFCLGFGEGVRFSFLEQLSLQNRGLARKIYEDSDAGLQLVGFFDEVATPLLVNIKIMYDDIMIVTNSISETVFPTYFEGTELVVAGQLAVNDSLPNIMTCVVTAESGGVEIELQLEANVKQESDVMLSPHAVDNFAQRLWAFLTIKEVLRKRIAADGSDEREALTQRALELSLKYHFVTPLTSLVVVRPDDDEPVITDSESPAGELLSADITPAGSLYHHASGPRYLQSPVRSSVPRQKGPKVLPPPAVMSMLVYSSVTTTAKSRARYVPTTIPLTTEPTTTATTTRQMGPLRGVRYRAYFVIQSELRDNVPVPLCFSIKARPGKLYKLIDDQVSGLAVNGHMASAYTAQHQTNMNETVPLVLDHLLLVLQGTFLNVSTETILIAPTLTMTWTMGWKASVEGVTFSIQDGQNLTIQLTSGVTLVITKHTGDQSMNKADYLGINIEGSNGLSGQFDGIIGQFERREIRLEKNSITREGDRVKGYLQVGRQRVEVRQSERQDLREDTARQCWWYSGGADVLDRELSSYRSSA